MGKAIFERISFVECQNKTVKHYNDRIIVQSNIAGTLWRMRGVGVKECLLKFVSVLRMQNYIFPRYLQRFFNLWISSNLDDHLIFRAVRKKIPDFTFFLYRPTPAEWKLTMSTLRSLSTPKDLFDFSSMKYFLWFVCGFDSYSWLPSYNFIYKKKIYLW